MPLTFLLFRNTRWLHANELPAENYFWLVPLFTKQGS